MKKTLISSLLAGAALLPLAVSAQTAPDGSIAFNGNVQGTTCTITVNGGSSEGTVNLPIVKTTELATAGSTVGTTSFVINLSGCALSPGGEGATPVAAGVAKPFFISGPATNSAGRLSNTLAGGAKNVDLQLLSGGNDAVINLAGAKDAQSVQGWVINNGTGGVTLKARYFATGRATPGIVRSNVQFYMDYQ